ncbi:MAG TPA: metallophosphoesterase family protein [Thermoplasmataceae archaeon]|nr:metallophosphoesterase family protein [Thermoplasmataceae archaeon]
MNILLISDAHGNYYALKQVLDMVKFDELVFLGDIVDYGPMPAETMDLLFSAGGRIIMGNHDFAAATGSDCACAPAMHDLSVYTRENITLKDLSRGDLERLKSLPDVLEFDLEGRRFYAVHGSPFNHLQGYVFSTELEIIWKDRNMKNFDFILFGHTHFQTLYRGKIMNPGSVGQPRDGVWLPSFATLDTASGEIVFRRFRYDNIRTWELLKSRIKDEKFLKQLEPFYLQS